MILAELLLLRDKFGMDPYTTPILYLPSLDGDPSPTGFPKDIPVVSTVIENRVTGEMAMAIVPKSEIQKMELVDISREIPAPKSKSRVN